MFGQILDAATNLFSVGSNAYWNNKTFKAQQAQQRWQNDYIMNQSQYRAADLEAAGLHPTLALGNAGHAPSSASGPHTNPQTGHGRIMENALISEEIKQRGAQRKLVEAQAKLANAQAADVIANTEDRPKQWEHRDKDRQVRIDELQHEVAKHGLNVSRFKKIEFPSHEQRIRFEKELHNLEKEQRQLNIDHGKVQKLISEYREKYMREHGSEVPTIPWTESQIKQLLRVNDPQELGFFKSLIWFLHNYVKIPFISK